MQDICSLQPNQNMWGLIRNFVFVSGQHLTGIRKRNYLTKKVRVLAARVTTALIIGIGND
jgi:hypothetical protein